MPPSHVAGVIRFGVFEVEPQTGILRKQGVRVRLGDQPFQVLLALLEQPGEVVSREELQQKVWPGVALGDLDHSLNITINRIREALGDPAETPRFVETLPRRGYRFIAPVQGGAEPTRIRKPIWLPLAGTIAAALAVLGGLASWVLIPPSPPIVRLRQITTDSEPKEWPALSDGARIYFLSRIYGSSSYRLMQVPVSGGQPTAVTCPLPGARFRLFDISPDGEELLMLASDARLTYSPLWTVRISDGSARRIAPVAYFGARYSPDGRRVVWSTSEKLYVAAADGSGAREIASTPGNGLIVSSWLDPDRISLERLEKPGDFLHAWMIAPDGSGFHRLLPQWERPHGLSALTPDGRFLLLHSEGLLWSLPVPRWPVTTWGSQPAQLTSGTPLLYAPHRARNGRVFALGEVRAGELQRFDLKTRSWQRHLGGISADCVEYSPDGQWVAYVRYPDRSLWRCRADGTQCLQLAGGSMGAYLPHWSPDGKTVAFATSESYRLPYWGSAAVSAGTPLRVWLINPDGSNLRLAAPSYREPHADPSWSADGKTIVCDRLVAGDDRFLLRLDVGTGQIAKIPGTDGLWSPRSSADGSRLLAIDISKSVHGYRLWVLGAATGEWRLTTDDLVEYPSWAPDNQSIIYGTGKEIRRFRLDTWKAETIVTLDRFQDMRANLGYGWVGHDPGGNPLVMRNRDSQQVYELEFAGK